MNEYLDILDNMCFLFLAEKLKQTGYNVLISEP